MNASQQGTWTVGHHVCRHARQIKDILTIPVTALK